MLREVVHAVTCSGKITYFWKKKILYKGDSTLYTEDIFDMKLC